IVQIAARTCHCSFPRPPALPIVLTIGAALHPVGFVLGGSCRVCLGRLPQGCQRLFSPLGAALLGDAASLCPLLLLCRPLGFLFLIHSRRDKGTDKRKVDVDLLPPLSAAASCGGVHQDLLNEGVEHFVGHLGDVLVLSYQGEEPRLVLLHVRDLGK